MSKQDSVKPLADLFTVVIGLSLTIALQSAIDVSKKFPLKLEILPALVAFLITILPFAHGAITHLVTTYGDSKKSNTTSAALLVDYFILFVNGCIFIEWASLLPNTEYATYAYLCILLVDAAWGVLARIFSAQHLSATPSLKWTTINLITFIILFIPALIVVGPIYKGGWDENISCVIAAIAILRTIVDYSWTWKFYIGRS